MYINIYNIHLPNFNLFVFNFYTPLFALVQITDWSITWWIVGSSKFPSKCMISSKADTTFAATFPYIKIVNRDIKDLIFTSPGIYANDASIRHYVSCENTVSYRNRYSNIQNIYRNLHTLLYWYNFPHSRSFISSE